jgi:hypothetical protein
MRQMYEPYVAALSEYLLMPLPARRATYRGRTGARPAGSQGGGDDHPTVDLASPK